MSTLKSEMEVETDRLNAIHEAETEAMAEAKRLAEMTGDRAIELLLEALGDTDLRVPLDWPGARRGGPEGEHDAAVAALVYALGKFSTATDDQTRNDAGLLARYAASAVRAVETSEFLVRFGQVVLEMLDQMDEVVERKLAGAGRKVVRDADGLIQAVVPISEKAAEEAKGTKGRTPIGFAPPPALPAVELG